MQEVIQQVGDLLLHSIPTLILFILLVLAYQFLIQKPLSKTLALRRGRTTGAVEAANRAIAAADAKAEEYATRLRHARAEVFQVREQRLREWALERDRQLDAARKKAQQHVLDLRLSLDAEADQTRRTLLASADQLADQVVRAVLPAVAGGSR
jgi:F-type H+-transporting ATPase subunit b